MPQVNTEDLDPSTYITVRQSDFERKCKAEILYRDDPRYLDVPSEPVTLGSTAHHGIEDVIRHGDEGLQRWSVIPFVEGQIIEQMKSDGAEDPLSIIGSKMRLRSLAEEASAAVHSWHRAFWRAWGGHLDVLAIEVKMMRVIGTSPVSGKFVVLQGSPDLVVRGGIWDWKTSKRDWKLTKPNARVQSPAYAYLSEPILGTVEVPFNYYVYNRSKATWATHTVHVDEPMVDAALRSMFQLAIAMETKAVVPQPFEDVYGEVKRGWWCGPKYCPAWEACEYKAMVADRTKLDTEIPKTWAAA